MKKLYIIFLIPILFGLTGCEEEYVDTGYTLNGHTIYSYDTKSEICAAWYSSSIEIDESTVFHYINRCPISYYIEVDGEYEGVFNYISNNEVSVEELKDCPLGYIEEFSSVLNYFDLSFDEFTITSVSIHELDGEIATGLSGEWDTNYTVDLELSDVYEYLLPLFTTNVSEDSYCEDNFCVLFKGQAPIKFTMEQDDTTLFISVYDRYIDLRVTTTDMDAHVYQVDTDDNTADALFEYIALLHQDSNK